MTNACRPSRRTGSLREAGVGGRDRRAVVDAAAAQVILQSWLDTHRA